MSALENEILEELYFPVSYPELLLITGATDQLMEEAILSLLEKDHISQMKFNKEKNDLEPVPFFEKELMKNSSYVVTRKGLLAHTGVI